MQGTLFHPPDIFPSANVVYLDKDYGFLRSKGLLAYGTLLECIASWQSGGQARQKYGIPSASNQGAILIGIGQFDVTDIVAPTHNTDYVSIIGVSTESSILNFTAGLINAAPHINIKNLTINSAGAAAIDLGDFVGVMERVNIDSANPYGLQSGTGLAGKIINCKFVGGSAFTTLLATSSSTPPIIQNCIFRGGASILLGGTSNNFIFSDCIIELQGGAGPAITCNSDFRGQFKNCIINNAVQVSQLSNTSLFSFDAKNLGYFESCYMHANRTIVMNNVSNGAIINNCYVLVSGTTQDIHAFSGVENGAIFNSDRIISLGSGASILSNSGVTIEINKCTLRSPNGPGFSITPNILMRNLTPFNVELSSGVRF